MKPKFYWNDWGPTQGDGDDGDQLQRLGLYYYGLYLRRKYNLSVIEYDYNTVEDYSRFLSLHEVQFGRYIRGKKWNDQADTSRDQLIPNIIAMGAYGLRSRLKIFLDQSVRSGLFPNGDFVFPQHRGMISRSLNEEPSWGSDECLIADTLCHIAKSFNPDFADDINLVLILIQSQEVARSANSARASRLYANQRRLSFGSSKLGAGNPMLGSFEWYFRPETGGCPGFIDMFKPIIELIFYGGS